MWSLIRMTGHDDFIFIWMSAQPQHSSPRRNISLFSVCTCIIKSDRRSHLTPESPFWFTSAPFRSLPLPSARGSAPDRLFKPRASALIRSFVRESARAETRSPGLRCAPLSSARLIKCVFTNSKAFLSAIFVCIRKRALEEACRLSV